MKYFIASIILLLAVGLMAGEKQAKKERKLEDVTVFSFVPTGISGGDSEGQWLFEQIFIHHKDPKRRFIEVFKNGTPAAKLYALTGLYHYDRKSFDKYVAELKTKGKGMSVTTMKGCLASTPTVDSLLRDLVRDGFKTYAAKTDVKKFLHLERQKKMAKLEKQNKQKEPQKKRQKAEKLQTRTKLTPVLETDIGDKDNLIYCVTFQLAWDELKKVADGDIKMEDQTNWVDILNAFSVEEGVVSPKNYVAAGGAVKDGIFERIDKELKEKFNKTLADMSFRPSKGARFVGFAYLYVKLPFKLKYHLFKKRSISFDDGETETKVVCFGCTPKSADKYEKDIRVRYYRNEDRFILQLLTRKKGETIVLAKMPKPETLKEAIDLTVKHVAKEWKSIERVKVKAKIKRIDRQFSRDDTLLVPVMKLDKQTNYNELCRKPLKNDIFRGSKGLRQAFQKVKFQLDESGATLESVAYEEEEGGSSNKPREYIFDKPFLVCLWREGAKTPYLAVWVNNTEFFREYE